jgi:glutaredoxin-related protein
MKQLTNKEIINIKGLNMIIKLKEKRNNYYYNKLMIIEDINEIKKLVKLRNENTNVINEIKSRIENYAG